MSFCIKSQGKTIFGSGATGVTLVVAGTTSLSADTYYQSITVNAGGILQTQGYRVFAASFIICNGTIRFNGNNGAAAGTAGTAVAGGSLGGNSAGGAGQTGAGSASAAVTNSVVGKGGNGGLGATGAGGVAGTATSVAAVNGSTLVLAALPYAMTFNPKKLVGTFVTGGTGGGGGGGNGVGNRGGGGGASGGKVLLVTPQLTGSGSIQANGGNGGTPTGTNSGGGGSGSGGILCLITANDVVAAGVSLSVRPGTPGGRTGTGVTGSIGVTGAIYRLNMSLGGYL